MAGLDLRVSSRPEDYKGMEPSKPVFIGVFHHIPLVWISHNESLLAFTSGGDFIYFYDYD